MNPRSIKTPALLMGVTLLFLGGELGFGFVNMPYRWIPITVFFILTMSFWFVTMVTLAMYFRSRRPITPQEIDDEHPDVLP